MLRTCVLAFALFPAAILQAAVITTTNPARNAKAAPRTTNIQATADGDIQSSTVTQSTFRIQGDLTGRIAGTYSTSGATFWLDPTNDLKPGEWIRVTATSGIQNTSAVALTPKVWQFTAATALSTGAMRAHPTTPSFGAGSSYAAALGDLDGDTDLDAVIVNSFDDANSVWLNDGAGNLAAHPTTPTFGSTYNHSAVALGDLDGDGDLDAIDVSNGGNAVWLNDGSGNFTAHPTTAVFGGGYGSYDIALGDVDADGDLDAVVANTQTVYETVWLNNGSGSFALHPTTPTFNPGSYTNGVDLGDLDGDGDLDAFLSQGSYLGGAEAVFLNDGSGGFTAHPTVPTFGGGTSMDAALGDLDGDGDLDAVVANYYSSGGNVWINGGSGNFTAHPTTPTLPAADQHDVALGDIDGDGDLDAVFTELNVGSTDIWINDGTGAFTVHPTVPEVAVGVQSGDVALGDLDGDGDLDLLVASYGAETVWINNAIRVTPAAVTTTEAGGNGTFTVVLEAQPSANVTIPIDTSDSTEGRISNDGFTQQNSLTLTFTNANWNTPQTVTVHGQNDNVDDGNIAYTVIIGAATSSDARFSGVNPSDVSATNTDDDTAGVSLTPGAVTVAESGATATFDVALTSEPLGDVRIDLASGDTSEATVSHALVTFTNANWSTPQTITVTGVDDVYDDGNVTSTILLTTNLNWTNDTTYDAINPPDVTVTTNDDDIGVLSTSPASNAIDIPRSTNIEVTAPDSINGATVSQSTFIVRSEQTARVNGAYNASGSLFWLDPTANLKPGELVHATMTNGVQTGSAVPLGPHVWQFTTETSTASGAMVPHPVNPSFYLADTYGVALGDLDDDGDLDAVTANWANVAERVWMNDGTGNFSEHGTTPAFGGEFSGDVTLGDLDGDGDLDAIVANWWNAAETIWLNDGDGNFSAPVSNASFGAGESMKVALGDLDGDGDLDAVVANDYGGAETVWLNDGSAVFTAHPGASNLGNQHSWSLALGDIDNDGDLDCVVANREGEAETVWLNDGSGRFFTHPTAPSFGAGSYSYGIALGDIDGDGDLDAVVANGNAQADTVWKNDGAGVFTAPVSNATFGDTGEGRDVVLGDIDGDGDLDAVVANYSGEAETVWLNDGTGAFSAHPSYPSFGTGSNSLALALGDIDGDGDLDTFVANGSGQAETVWINRAAAGITVTPTSGLTTTEAGGTAMFTIALASAPVANVVIDVSSSDTSEGTVSPAQLTFTTSDWATPQTVTLTGQNDAIDDGNVIYTILTAPAVSTDLLYSGFNASDVSATNNDDADTAGVTVSINSWTQLFATGTAPSARAGAGGGAYDAAHDRLTFFSGHDGSARPQDTWLLVNATSAPSWTQLSPTGGPPSGRFAHRSVYAAPNNRMIVYGGCTAFCGTGLSDAWALTNANGIGGTPAWVSLAGGANRHAFATGYDPSTNRMMVYGGLTHVGNSCMTNEQVLENADGTASSSWSALSPGAGPGARGEDVNGAYDATSNRLIVFGGYDCSTYRNDLWVLTNANGLGGSPSWIELTPSGALPTGRNYHSTVYDANTNRLILFGGNDGTTNLNETWVLTNANGLTGTPQWIRQTPSGALPSKRRMHLFAYASSSNRMMIAMGELESGIASDIWVLNNANGTLTVDESGTTATFTVVLDSEPAGNVVVEVTSDDTSEVTVSPSLLTFTSGTWSTPQTVTVTGVADAAIDGNVLTSIIVWMNEASTNDALYDAIDPDDVTAMTVDDDFVIVSTDPPPNTRNIARTTNISATASGPVQSATVTQSTYRVQGEQTGRIAGTTSGSITAIALDPANSLKPGEKIHVTATSGILGPNDSALVPRVWQLTAAAGAASAVFLAHPTTPTFGGTYLGTDVALGDLDGDGDLDAIIENQGGDETVWANDGDGNFSALSTFDGGSFNRAIAVGDVDGDGDLDALLAGTPNERVRLNNGSGVFTPHPITPDFGGNGENVALGDVDGDGDLDAIIAVFSGPETVWLNDGTGGFTAHPVSASFGGDGSLHVALGDLDVDGDLDVIVGNTSGQPETVWLNDGSGVFSAHVTPSFGGMQTFKVALGDLDGDGDLDALCVNGDDAETVWLNDGTGAFTQNATLSGTISSYDGDLGDLDGDGDLDALIVDVEGVERVWLNDGSGGFALHPIAQPFTSDTTFASALGDIDGDGDLDAVLANYSSPASVWINRDPVGITVTPTSGLTTTEAGGTTSFTVVLTSAPVANVVVDVSSSDTSEGTVSPAQLTFTTANWSTPQTVTLTGQNDAVDDGNVAYMIVTAAAVSSDALYSGFNASDVSASNTDDDTAGVTVSINSWMQLFPTGTAPDARAGSGGGAYDALHDRLTFFGGSTGPARLQDTWLLANATGAGGTPSWIQLAPTGGPPAARHAHRSVYAAPNNRMIVYGGCTANCGVGLDDAWALTNANGYGGTPAWVSLASGANRHAHATGYDSATNRMMVYGGLTHVGSSCMTNEQVLTNADGTASSSWSALSPGAGPGPRGEDVNGAYDAASNRLIVVGGYNCATYLNDVWVLTNANGLGGTPAWVQLAPSGTPPSPRNYHSTIYDAITNRVILFGGNDGVTNLNETWVLTHANGLTGTPEWRRQTPSGALPPVRRRHLFAYAPSSNRMMIAMGELASGVASDVWVLNNANGTLTVDENGSTATFTVVLDSEPAGDVVIDVTSLDTSEAAVSPSQLTFTSATWSTPQTVTVTGVSDAIIDGDVLTTVSVAMNTASTNDALYDAIDPDDVTVITTDDDFVIVSTDPPPNTRNIARTANLAATASGNVQASTVTQSTYRVHGQQTGRIAGTYSGSSTAITLDPSSSLKPGETIHITATSGILGPNNSALVPRVWQLTAAAGVAAGVFVQQASFGTADNSMDVAIGDLDGDGDVDAVIANASDQPETVWLNDGAGNFTAHPTTPTFGGDTTQTIVLGDLDGDGDLDALAGNDVPGQGTTVWLNGGGGSFSAHTTPKFGGEGDLASDLALGDVDADGDLDVVLAGAGTIADSVWLNDGTGVFTPHPVTPTINAGVDNTAIALGDIDNDGDLDLVSANTLDQAETALLNDGSGVFSAHGSFGAGKSAGIALGDLDGDGDLDALVVNGDPMQPETVWLNNGSGTFTAHPTTPSFGLEDGWDLALGDIDGDGDLDAIVANIGGGDSDTIWLNDGSANFTAHPIVDRIDGPSSPGVALGDVDGDGDLDAIFANESAAETVWINRPAAGITVTPTSGLTTTEAGGEATFTIVLTSQPIADVVIDVSSSDPGEGSVSPAQLTFTTANWSSAQTVTVHGENDAIDDGNVAYTVTTAAAVSTDPLYSGFNASDVSATNDDDSDTAGVSVVSGTLIVSESGTTATFTVVLQSEPIGDVVIDVSSTDASEATVAPAQLTFTSANWSSVQTVTITGVADAVIDGDMATAIGVAMNAGATNDPLYDAIDPNDATVTTTDDDFVIVATNPVANAKAVSRTTNIAATASGTVQSPSVTQSTVRVQGAQTGRIAGAYGASGTAITLDPSSNLKPGERIHVTATSAILGPNNSALVPRVWQFTAAASVATAAMGPHPTTPQFGGNDPSGDVTLGDLDGDGDLDAILANQNAQDETVWANDGAGNFTALSTFDSGFYTKKMELGDLDGDGDLDALLVDSLNERVMLNNGSGTFTAHPVTPDFGNDTGQRVALGDLDADGDLDAVVAAFNAPETVWLNDGTGAFSAHPSAASFGSDDSWGLALGDLDGDGDLDAVVGNANSQPETVWLNDGRGVFSAHGNFGADSTAHVVLGDADGDGDLDVLCVNNDAAETVWLNNGSGAFTQTATLSGATTSYDGELGDLDGDGDLDVLITDVNGTERVFLNNGAASFAPHPLVPTFTSLSSDASAIGDIDGDGDLDAVLANYAAPATVWINRPAPGITVTPTSGLTTTEAGGEATFTVVLTAQPVADVVIDVSSSDSTEASVSPAQLTFTSANWSSAQTVTLHGLNDAIDDDNVAYTITTAAAVSSDPLYAGFNASDVSATNNDNDTAGVNVSTATLSVSETGTSAPFTIVLTSESVGNVVIDITSTDTGEATVAPPQITFTNANWSAPQTITVTGVNDALDDGDQATTISITVNAAATADALYDAIDPSDVTATTVDDDAPFGAPPNFAATATSTSTVATSWSPVAGATNYEVWRDNTLVTTTTNTSFTDSGRTANTTYLYKVRANGSGGPSPFSPIDPATTVIFTDPVLTTSTLIKAVHITQLRTAVNAMRAAAALSPATFTDPTPVAIKRIHIIELRTALDQARSAIGLTAITYTDPTITAGVTKVKKEHISELRAGTQ